MATSSFSLPWNNASFHFQHSSMDKWIVEAAQNYEGQTANLWNPTQTSSFTSAGTCGSCEKIGSDRLCAGVAVDPIESCRLLNLLINVFCVDILRFLMENFPCSQEFCKISWSTMESLKIWESRWASLARNIWQQSRRCSPHQDLGEFLSSHYFLPWILSSFHWPLVANGWCLQQSGGLSPEDLKWDGFIRAWIKLCQPRKQMFQWIFQWILIQLLLPPLQMFQILISSTSHLQAQPSVQTPNLYFSILSKTNQDPRQVTVLSSQPQLYFPCIPWRLKTQVPSQHSREAGERWRFERLQMAANRSHHGHYWHIPINSHIHIGQDTRCALHGSPTWPWVPVTHVATKHISRNNPADLWTKSCFAASAIVIKEINHFNQSFL